MGQYIEENADVNIGEGQITLEVMVGNIMQNKTTVAFNGKQLVSGNDYVHAFLNEDLKTGDEVVVYVTAVDTNPNSKYIPVTVAFHEDSGTVLRKTYIATTKDYEGAMFTLTFTLKKKPVTNS